MSQSVTSPQPVLPAAIGQYRVVQRLGGKPNMGEVFLAEDTLLPGRAVAIKTVPISRDLPTEQRDEFGRRLEEEARALANLKHPGIPTLYHTILESGALYVVMEFIEGRGLSEIIREGGPLRQEDAVRLALGVLDALAAAHAKGILHRDVKPGNIMLAADNAVKLIDFGLAKSVEADFGITQPGVVPGTPAYMAPEQIEMLRCSPASDIFSLGIVLYEALTGARPFQSTSNSPFGVTMSILTDTPRDIREVAPTLHPRLAAAVMKALAKRPEDRFAGAEAMAEELRSVLGELTTSAVPSPAAPVGLPGRRVRWGLVAAAAVAGSALVIFAFGYLAPPRRRGQAKATTAAPVAPQPKLTPLPVVQPRPKEAPEEPKQASSKKGVPAVPPVIEEPQPRVKAPDTPEPKVKDPSPPDDTKSKEPAKAPEPAVKVVEPPPKAVEPRPEPMVLGERQLTEVQAEFGRIIHNAATEAATQQGKAISLQVWALDRWHADQIRRRAPKTLDGFPGLELQPNIVVSKDEFLKRLRKALNDEGFRAVTLTALKDADGDRLRVEVECQDVLPAGSSRKIEEIGARFHPLVHSSVQEHRNEGKDNR